MANGGTSSSSSASQPEVANETQDWIARSRVGLGGSPNIMRTLEFSVSRFGSLTKSRHSLFEVSNPVENWLCLCCKEVLCSRFVNRHMLMHHQQTAHCLALSYSDLSIWCFCCEAYLDAQIILQLRPIHQAAYILKFGEASPYPNFKQ